MARLHEYQAKSLLRSHGLSVPIGEPVLSSALALDAAKRIGKPVVVKIQAWTTGRKALGGVVFAETPGAAAAAAERLLAMKVGNFPVDQVLVEEQVSIANELFVSLIIDDAARCPMILLSVAGGTGVEDRAAEVHRLACDIRSGPDRAKILAILGQSEMDVRLHGSLADAVQTIFEVAKQYEARSLEVNPLVTTTDGRVLAADCRMTIDDCAVFRHDELGIDIARELDHPPTPLERVAYAVEQADHRGTFYFAQLNTTVPSGSRGLVGFHGAGGGGSMMSMDALVAEGFTIANFCDTSGNPSVAKVYRAARIILSQHDLVGYFGSGSGVASQEQFWSAYGLAKAFWEVGLSIPAVIRLGGNSEDRAVEILEDACRGLPGTVAAYRKNDTPKFIAERFAEFVEQAGYPRWRPSSQIAAEKSSWNLRKPNFVGLPGTMVFPIPNGRVWMDRDGCDEATTGLIVQLGCGLFTSENGKPALAVPAEELAGKESELIALEVELRRAGTMAVFIELDIPGLETCHGDPC
ncbi:MAG: acetate--CoA ligase family protein [Pirellulales bacterium]|nr:acetate--CoA ligase family protein [Pirellulales bacterium]